MALVAFLIGNDDFLFLLPWMATRAIPTSLISISLSLPLAGDQNSQNHLDWF